MILQSAAQVPGSGKGEWRRWAIRVWMGGSAGSLLPVELVVAVVATVEDEDAEELLLLA
jgi:hypothetical protein